MIASATDPRIGWNLLRDIGQLFDFPFMVHAYLAGTIVAVVAAVIGWFMVLRRESFAGHTLALIGFPGAAGAIVVGLSATYGYFSFCVGAAVVIGSFGAGRTEQTGAGAAITGLVQAVALGFGYLFVSLYGHNINGVTSLLFGNLLGITRDQVYGLVVVALGALGVLALMARPLLFASVDADAAAARGLPVRALSIAFLVLLGVAAAEASQITGSLLVFALLVMPAATAQVVVLRPAASLAAAVLVGVAITWVGLAAAYYSPYPMGFWITTFGFGAYLAAHLLRAARRRARPHTALS